MTMGAWVRTLRCVAVLIFGLFSGLVQPATAQTNQQLQACKSDTVDPDVKIRGCSAFIDSGRAVGGRPLPRKALWAATSLRGVGYFKKNDLDHALTDLSAAIRIDPSQSESYGYRGLVYVNLKQYDRARADFSEALRLSPNYTFARNWLQSLDLSKQMDTRWARYLQEIQDERDYANWSAPPLELYRNAK
jgi:tetratricopeptide (TPR) repeat protein